MEERLIFNAEDLYNNVWGKVAPKAGEKFTMLAFPNPMDADDGKIQMTHSSIVASSKEAFMFQYVAPDIIFFSRLKDFSFANKSSIKERGAKFAESIGADASSEFGNAYAGDTASLLQFSFPVDRNSEHDEPVDTVLMENIMASLKAQAIDPISALAVFSKKYVGIKKRALQEQKNKTEYKELETKTATGEYLQQSSRSILDSNRAMEAKWKSVAITIDKKNPVETSVARAMYYGNDILLLGETGVGKTHTPNEIAKKNNFSFHIVQFQSKTDSVDLHGADTLQSSVFSPDPKMRYRYGAMSKAFLEAREDYKNGKPSILVLDEVMRAEDMSPLISSLSVFDETKEFCLTLPNEIELVKIKTENAGELWLKVDHNIDKSKQGYAISGGKIYVDEAMANFLCVDEGVADIMASRGDIMTITEEDARKIKSAIVKTKQVSESIRVPSSAIRIVGTSNIGDNYEVSMHIDNAFFRRMKPTPVETPSISFMVKAIIKKYEESGDILPENSSAKKDIVNIVTKFLDGLAVLIKGKQIDTVHKINFATVDDIIRAVDKDDPVGSDSFGNIFEVLKDKATHFANIDASKSVADIKADRSVKMIVDQVEKIKAMHMDGNNNSLLAATASPSPRR